MPDPLAVVPARVCSYLVSLEQDPSLPGYKEAVGLLQKHNPECYEAIAAGKTGV